MPRASGEKGGSLRAAAGRAPGVLLTNADRYKIFRIPSFSPEEVSFLTIYLPNDALHVLNYWYLSWPEEQDLPVLSRLRSPFVKKEQKLPPRCERRFAGGI